jgi:hypothetical protein
MQFNLAQSERVAGEKGISVQNTKKRPLNQRPFFGVPELAEIYFSG